MSSLSTPEAPYNTAMADIPQELSNEESPFNAITSLPISAFSADSSSEDEDDYNLSTNDEYDIELGTARLFPMHRAPVRRLIIRRRQTAPVIPARPVGRVSRKANTAPTSPIRGRITTSNPVSERPTRRGRSPPPAIPRSPPLIPQKSTKRYGIVLPLNLKRVEGIKSADTPSPPPTPERPLKRTVVSVPVPASLEEENGEWVVLEPVPVLKRGGMKEKMVRQEPPPLPERSFKRAAALRLLEMARNPSFGHFGERKEGGVLAPTNTENDPPFGHSGQHEKRIILAPVAQRVPSKGTFYDPNRNFGDLFSASDSEKEAKVVKHTVDWQGMHDMYEEIQAGHLAFPSSPDVLGFKAEGEEKAEEEAYEKIVLEAQATLFQVADDGVSFRNPFVEQGLSADDVDDVSRIVLSPPTNERKASKESIETAISDESIHGLLPSPKISPRTTKAEKHEGVTAAAEVVMPKPIVQQNDFISAVSPQLDVEQVGAKENEGQDEIVNLYSDQFTLPEGGETILSDERSWSRSSDYSAPSRPSSIPRVRSRGETLYSSIGNPWHAEVKTEINEVWVRQANAIFAGLDAEALVADTPYELQNTDEAKGSLDFFNLAPHEPDMGCGCQHCHKHYRPSHEDSKGVHDSNEWCHCLACRLFREKAEEEEERAEHTAFWSAKFDEIATEVDAAKAEEGSRWFDLTDLKTKKEEATVPKPKKTHIFGRWVMRHLRSPRGE